MDRVAETRALIDKAPNCRSLFNVWLTASPEGTRPPLRTDLDPLVLAKSGLLPTLWLLQRDGDGYSIRLVGGDVRNMFSDRMTGQRLSDVLDGDALDIAVYTAERTIGGRRVLYTTGQVYAGAVPHYYAYRLTLPLTDENGDVRFLIGTVDRKDLNRLPPAGTTPRYEIDFSASFAVDKI